MDPDNDQLAGSPKDDTPQLPLPGNEPAADVLRQKISAIYEHEPSAKQELGEVMSLDRRKLSKHQRFMFELNKSGKSEEEIQTDWHDYYAHLSDKEKHEVWQEFHAHKTAKKDPLVIEDSRKNYHQPPVHDPKKTPAEIKRIIRSNVTASSQLGAKQHLKALIFGITTGMVVLLVLLFGLFNERFLAPFVTPNKAVTSTPIIADGTQAVGKDPKVIIPKINVEIPVIYGVGSVEEKTIQKALERGVVHYANTSVPGQKGNSVIVGHSSNNIFNRGQYKFAFVLLNKLQDGDTFMMEKDGVRYTYRVNQKKVVAANDLSVLAQNPSESTVTLITCDPPGTSINRLVVVGEQVSPDPTANVSSTATTTSAQPKIIPGNAPSLWSRFTDLF